MALRVTALLAVLAVLALGGCGGGGGESGGTTGAVTTSSGEVTTSSEEVTTSSEEVPADAVAVVAGTPVPRAEFDRFLRQAKAAYEAQGATFPDTGSPEYEQLKQQAVDILVRRVEFAKEAEALGIAVAEPEIDERLSTLKEQYYSGDDAKYEEELNTLGITEADVKTDLRAQLVNEKLFDEMTKDVTVPDADVRAYYDENADRFTTPELREVAHILVETKKKADELYQKLEDGADFAKLAKKNSTDEATAENGGRLTARKGELVPEFEQVAFELATGDVSQPVETQFGWHLVKALGDVQPETVTPFEQVQQDLLNQLLAEERNQVMTDWVTGVRTKYAGQVAYAVGFEPAPTPGVTTTTP